MRSTLGLASVAVATALWSLTVLPAAADEGDGPSNRRATATNNGDSATGTAEESVPAIPAGNGGRNGGPNCTRSDGTPDYLRYGPRLFSTMEEQRTLYHPDEQRPGEWLHLYCGDEWLDFVFLPEEQQVDPTTLAAVCDDHAVCSGAAYQPRRERPPRERRRLVLGRDLGEHLRASHCRVRHCQRDGRADVSHRRPGRRYVPVHLSRAAARIQPEPSGEHSILELHPHLHRARATTRRRRPSSTTSRSRRTSASTGTSERSSPARRRSWQSPKHRQ